MISPSPKLFHQATSYFTKPQVISASPNAPERFADQLKSDLGLFGQVTNAAGRSKPAIDR
jgi:hypothetical protein